MKVQENKLTTPDLDRNRSSQFLNSVQLKNCDDSRFEPEHSYALNMPRCKNEAQNYGLVLILIEKTGLFL